MNSEDSLLKRIAEMVRVDAEAPKVKTLDPQVRTTKYAGTGRVKDASATQDFGPLQEVKSLKDFK